MNLERQVSLLQDEADSTLREADRLATKKTALSLQQLQEMELDRVFPGDAAERSGRRDQKLVAARTEKEDAEAAESAAERALALRQAQVRFLEEKLAAARAEGEAYASVALNAKLAAARDETAELAVNHSEALESVAAATKQMVAEHKTSMKQAEADLAAAYAEGAQRDSTVALEFERAAAQMQRDLELAQQESERFAAKKKSTALAKRPSKVKVAGTADRPVFDQANAVSAEMVSGMLPASRVDDENTATSANSHVATTATAATAAAAEEAAAAVMAEAEAEAARAKRDLAKQEAQIRLLELNLQAARAEGEAQASFVLNSELAAARRAAGLAEEELRKCLLFAADAASALAAAHRDVQPSMGTRVDARPASHVVASEEAAQPNKNLDPVSALLLKLGQLEREEVRIRQAWGSIKYEQVKPPGSAAELSPEDLTELASIPVRTTGGGRLIAAMGELPEHSFLDPVPDSHAPPVSSRLIRVTNNDPRDTQGHAHGKVGTLQKKEAARTQLRQRQQRPAEPRRPRVLSLPPKAAENIALHQAQFRKHMLRTAVCDADDANPWKLTERIGEDILASLLRGVANEVAGAMDGMVDKLVVDELGPEIESAAVQ